MADKRRETREEAIKLTLIVVMLVLLVGIVAFYAVYVWPQQEEKQRAGERDLRQQIQACASRGGQPIMLSPRWSQWMCAERHQP